MSIDIGLAVGFYFSLVSSYQGIFARPRKISDSDYYDYDYTGI